MSKLSLSNTASHFNLYNALNVFKLITFPWLGLITWQLWHVLTQNAGNVKKSKLNFRGLPNPSAQAFYSTWVYCLQIYLASPVLCIVTPSHTQGSLYSSLHISSESREHKPGHYTCSVCCECWSKGTGNHCHQNNSGKGQSNQGNWISHLVEKQSPCNRCGGWDRRQGHSVNSAWWDGFVCGWVCVCAVCLLLIKVCNWVIPIS